MTQSNGVKFYTHGIATVNVFFPDGKTYCNWCQFVRSDEALKRCRCVLTGEYLPYPFTAMGNRCPIVFMEDEEHEYL
jgi:hypothetical protein